MATPNKYPPILMLSDFMHFDATLKSNVTAWNNFLKGSTNVNGVDVKNHNGYDNRVSVNNATSSTSHATPATPTATATRTSTSTTCS